MSETGKIFNIQKFSTHDGPGIRTVIFLKGCPLRCPWCSNPESQRLSSDIFWDERKCIGCLLCQKICPKGLAPGRQGIDEECLLCGRCVEKCPAQALEMMGENLSVALVMEEVKKDCAFYHESGGGITISGGEPLLNPDFVLALAREAEKEEYHIAIETTGYAEWDVAKKIFEKMDLILYDLKHMDSKLHRKYTGVGNEKILDNARKASQKGYPLVYRIPLLGGINADMRNMKAVRDFALDTGVREIHLLPYHKYGENKYRLLRTEYTCSAYRPSKEEIGRIQDMLESAGITVKIGG